jgi:hypothetical protein
LIGNVVDRRDVEVSFSLTPLFPPKADKLVGIDVDALNWRVAINA